MFALGVNGVSMSPCVIVMFDKPLYILLGPAQPKLGKVKLNACKCMYGLGPHGWRLHGHACQSRC